MVHLSEYRTKAGNDMEWNILEITQRSYISSFILMVPVISFYRLEKPHVAFLINSAIFIAECFKTTKTRPALISFLNNFLAALRNQRESHLEQHY